MKAIFRLCLQLRHRDHVLVHSLSATFVLYGLEIHYIIILTTGNLREQLKLSSDVVQKHLGTVLWTEG